MKIPRDQHFLKSLNQPVWHQQPCNSPNHWDHICPHSGAYCEPYLKHLTCTFIVLHIALLPDDWVTAWMWRHLMQCLFVIYLIFVVFGHRFGLLNWKVCTDNCFWLFNCCGMISFDQFKQDNETIIPPQTDHSQIQVHCHAYNAQSTPNFICTNSLSHHSTLW